MSESYAGKEDLTKPVADTWFSVERYPSDIVRFREHHIDPYAVGDFWLLAGSQKALVADTGSGIMSSASLVASLVGKPVIAVALNSYYDHAGGWHAFAERACHPLDAPALQEPQAESDAISTYLNETTLWALPREDFRLADFRMTPAQPTLLLEDGDELDLGGRIITALHLPGRSPGGLALWEAATGSLFTSDMLYDGSHGPAWPPDQPSPYVESLKRLRDLPVQQVYPGHYGVMSPSRMHQVIDEQLASLEKRPDD
ncbi:MAG: MBL fold metallo-hydrolase [Pseudomonadota bacterium]